MRLIGSCSFEPVRFAMNPGISTTHSRPLVSQSIATGSCTRGSLATSSIR